MREWCEFIARFFNHFEYSLDQRFFNILSSKVGSTLDVDKLSHFCCSLWYQPLIDYLQATIIIAGSSACFGIFWTKMCCSDWNVWAGDPQNSDFSRGFHGTEHLCHWIDEFLYILCSEFPIERPKNYGKNPNFTEIKYLLEISTFSTYYFE